MQPVVTAAQLRAELCRKDLQEFIKHLWHVVEPSQPFIENYHIDALCDHLANIDQIGNLLICMPPGFAKSLLVSVFFPAWRWISNPAERFIYASHSASLAQRDSLRCRRVIESPLYQQYYGHLFKLTEDQNTKTRYDTDKTGFRLATSVDGAATGERGNLIVADDAFNLRHVNSKAHREAVLTWWAETFSNRVIPQRHARIIVGQRYHVDDLPGHIIKSDIAGNWCKLILPLEYGKCRFVSTRWEDPRTREGELLCPALMDAKKVAEQRAESGKRGFEAQYNQQPQNAEDAIFNVENIKTYDELPDQGTLRIAAVDLAISGTGDYTVVTVADVCHDGSIYLVHQHREKMQGPKIVPTIKAVHAHYHPSIIYVEDVAFQRIIIQE